MSKREPRTEGLREEIAGEAKRLGLNLLGFAGVERWGQFPYPRAEFYPQTIWPWSRTVIVGGMRIFLPMLETTPSAVYSELYNTANRLLDDAGYRLANTLCSLGYKALFYPRDGYGDISALVEKPEASFSQTIAARFAGLGTIGANHCVLTPEYGPRVRFVSVITDAELPQSPLLEKDLCVRCGNCRKRCPVGAFSPVPNTAPVPDFGIDLMDRRRCARYHRLLRDEWRYPCGVCTLVCPVGSDRDAYAGPSVSEEGIDHVQDHGARRRGDFLARVRRFIMSNENYKFETLQIHVGQEQPDSATDSRAVPIYQTSSYVFKDPAQAAGRFALSEPGNIYTRIMNPTWDVFEKRIAALEGGAAALACASGAAATTYAIQNIARTGDHIVSDFQIYGGTFNLFANTLKDFGVEVSFVDGSKPENFEKAIRPNTKAVFFETVGNPNASVVDIEAVVKIAHKHGIPVIVDNTFATPYLLRPIEFGADIVVHSATKFIGGHGTSIGGVIVDAGKFDWARDGKFPGLSKPNPSYHGVVFTDAAKNLAYIIKARTTLLRDTGAALSPFNAFLFLQGLETLSLRVERHVENALKVVDFLKSHPQVERVNHPSLEGHRDHALYRRYFPKGGASIFTFEIRGGAAAAKGFIAGLRLFSLLANVADVKSLVIHPASTTHSQVDEKDLLEQGIKPNTVRLSVGTEHIDDILNDLRLGFESAR